MVCFKCKTSEAHRPPNKKHLTRSSDHAAAGPLCRTLKPQKVCIWGNQYRFFVEIISHFLGCLKSGPCIFDGGRGGEMFMWDVHV